MKKLKYETQFEQLFWKVWRRFFVGVAFVAMIFLLYRKRFTPMTTDLDLIQSHVVNDIEEWFRCGEQLERNKMVKGTLYAWSECFVMGIEGARPLLDAYYNVGSKLQGGGKTYAEGLSHVECYARAVTLATRVLKAWYYLGEKLLLGGLTVTIEGKEYTQVECYYKFISMDPAMSKAWEILGVALAEYGSPEETGPTVEVGGDRVDATKCFLWALRYDSSRSVVWYHLALVAFHHQDSVSFKGRMYTQRQCLIEALKTQSEVVPIQAWTMLAKMLNEGESVFLGQNEFSKKDLNDHATAAWRAKHDPLYHDVKVI